MTLDHLGKLLEGFQTLPLQTGLPVVEEATRPTFSLIAPELAERFIEQVGCVEPLVGGQQYFQRCPAICSEVFVMAQQAYWRVGIGHLENR